MRAATLARVDVPLSTEKFLSVPVTRPDTPNASNTTRYTKCQCLEFFFKCPMLLSTRVQITLRSLDWIKIEYRLLIMK